MGGDLAAGADGVVPAVGNTVNVQDASYVNSIGAVQLSAAWTSPIGYTPATEPGGDD